MADNEHVNKVIVNNETLIDLTNDTVESDKLALGFTAHDASGAMITGTLTTSSNAEDISIEDSENYFESDNVEGALQEIGFDLNNHFSNNSIHVTIEDKTNWNGKSENAVEYVEQSLTEDQKYQARENIGAAKVYIIEGLDVDFFDEDSTVEPTDEWIEATASLMKEMYNSITPFEVLCEIDGVHYQTQVSYKKNGNARSRYIRISIVYNDSGEYLELTCYAERISGELISFDVFEYFSDAITDGDVNAVQGGVIKTALDGKQDVLTAGDNITIVGNVISASGGGGTSDYEDLGNLPLINGVELIGDKSLSDLGIETDRAALVRADSTSHLIPVGANIYMLDESNSNTRDITCEKLYSEPFECLVFVKKGGKYYPAKANKALNKLYIVYEYYDADDDGNFKQRMITYNPSATDKVSFSEKMLYATSANWSDPAYYYTAAPTVEAVSDYVDDAVSGKQDTLTAGQNITIVGNVISASGGGGSKDWELFDTITIDTSLGNVQYVQWGHPTTESQSVLIRAKNAKEVLFILSENVTKPYIMMNNASGGTASKVHDNSGAVCYAKYLGGSSLKHANGNNVLSIFEVIFHASSQYSLFSSGGENNFTGTTGKVYDCISFVRFGTSGTTLPNGLNIQVYLR